MDALTQRADTGELDRPHLVTEMPDNEVSASEKRGGLRGWLMLLGVIVVSCVVILHGVRKGEFDYNVDEAQHAVTGLFVADAMHDLPFRHPVQYAYTYYAQYPALAIVHWPPLFYMIEGLSFLLLGPSVVSARLTILLFTILMIYSWFRLVEDLQDSFTATVAAALLSLIPMVLLFEKTVMLEIPSLAVAIATIHMWIKYLTDGRMRLLYLFALWLSAALLVKQTNIYILVFCALTLLVTRKWHYLFNRHALAAMAICLVLVGPFYFLMLVSQGHAVAIDLGSHQMTGLQRAAFYWRILPRTFTIPLLGLSILGLLIARRWSAKGQTLVMICWIGAGYVTFTFFGQAEERFAIYWFPPLVYFAAGLLSQAFRMPKIRLAMRATAVVVVCVMAVNAWAYQRPYIAGYETVASQLIRDYRWGIVLFDGDVPGNFVFYMRALDPQRQFLVLRKVLYVNDIRKGANSEELLHGRDEMMDLFRRDGIRFVVVSENTPPDMANQVTLRHWLQTDQFRLLGRFNIRSNETRWQGGNLALYENKLWAPPADKFLRIRMLTLNHDIVVPLDRFDFIGKQGSANGAGEK